MAELGNAKNIIVGAASIYIADPGTDFPAPITNASYADALTATASGWASVGYTTNGMELQFAPEFGEVQVDQMLDVAKMFKSGMTVTLNTSMAETQLENLVVAIASRAPISTSPMIKQKDETVASTVPWGTGASGIDMMSGSLGECPVEKTLVAIGAGQSDCDTASPRAERVYTAYRVLSIESVTLSHKRDEASVFDVSFRLLPDGHGRYGQIIDRTWTPAA